MKIDLYVITDEAIAGGRSHADIARLAIAGGADVIQLRDKMRESTDLIRIAREIREITRDAGVCFIVNDRLDIALACGADGVHLGQGDISPGIARQLAPPGFIIGVSVGNPCEACRAEREGADYIALSPTFSTGSKTDAGPGHGCSVLEEIYRRVSIPVIAIGGIGPDNISEVILAGAQGVAVISAVVEKPDITAAARELATIIASEKKKWQV
ncbi:thiamine phosphate synthase [Methanoregula sp.]|uniref:thiamine phosphate synthase n=1 Tax=Methanoregula sp. TaxID=2052170 RepID=UPI00356371C1